MKPLFLFLGLLTSSIAFAQQPNAGFGSKQKNTAPVPGLAQRLAAEVIPTPKNQLGQPTLLATGQSRPSTRPLRLRVVRDTATGLPIFIERTGVRSTSSTNAGARLSAAAAASAAFAFLNEVRGLLQLDNPDASFTVSQTDTDELGQTHVRLLQTYRGIPVLGQELVAHLTGTDVTVLNGHYQPIQIELATQPKLLLPDAGKLALADVRQTVRIRSFGDNMLNLQQTEGTLCIFPMADGATFKFFNYGRADAKQSYFRGYHLIDHANV